MAACCTPQSSGCARIACVASSAAPSRCKPHSLPWAARWSSASRATFCRAADNGFLNPEAEDILLSRTHFIPPRARAGFLSEFLYAVYRSYMLPQFSISVKGNGPPAEPAFSSGRAFSCQKEAPAAPTPTWIQMQTRVQLARKLVATRIPHSRVGLHSSAPALQSEPARALEPRFEVEEAGSPEPVLAALQDGSLSHHALERELGDSELAVAVRRMHLESSTKSEHELSFDKLPMGQLDTKQFYDSVLGTNCENVVGYVPVPVGVVGPLAIDGREYTVPLATTEGALIASANRGARAITEAGGVTSELLQDSMTRAPVVSCENVRQAASLKAYCEDPENLPELQRIFSGTSRFGTLEHVKVAIAGRHAHLRFSCSTGDAMGMNMVGKGVNTLMAALIDSFPGTELLALSGNMCTDKKPSALNWIEGRGKSVVCEAVIPGAIVKRVLKADPRRVALINLHKNLIGSALAGSIGGNNAHASNVVTAIFMACGQDPAQNVESSNCLTTIEAVPARRSIGYNHRAELWGYRAEPFLRRDQVDSGDDFDLRIECTMPSIECGTVGGGTGLQAQGACLNMLGLHGSSDKPGQNSQQLARIVCATVMCGELSLLSALSSNHLISAHLALNRKPQK